jgi:hypothetical protein
LTATIRRILQHCPKAKPTSCPTDALVAPCADHLPVHRDRPQPRLAADSLELVETSRDR